MSTVPLADWTAPVGALGSAVAAVAAVLATVYAKQAADAGRGAIREERDLHIEQDYREFGRALWLVRQAALRARDHPDSPTVLPLLRETQTELQAAFVMPRWVDLGEDAPRMMDTTLSLASTPAQVVQSASRLTAQLQAAWNRRVEDRRGPAPSRS